MPISKCVFSHTYCFKCTSSFFVCNHSDSNLPPGLVLITIWNVFFLDSILNIDLLSAAIFFFKSKFVVLYLWFDFFAQSLLLFNFWPIHNGCCVSESGWSWALGLRARQQRNERRRLTKSLSQAPATMQKRVGDYLPQWKEEQTLVDSSKACVCDLGWQRIIWNTVYLELQVLHIWRTQTAAAPWAFPFFDPNPLAECIVH